MYVDQNFLSSLILFDRLVLPGKMYLTNLNTYICNSSLQITDLYFCKHITLPVFSCLNKTSVRVLVKFESFLKKYISAQIQNNKREICTRIFKCDAECYLKYGAMFVLVLSSVLDILTNTQTGVRHFLLLLLLF